MGHVGRALRRAALPVCFSLLLVQACDVDLLDCDRRFLMGRYSLLLFEDGQYYLESGSGRELGRGGVLKVGWTDSVIVAQTDGVWAIVTPDSVLEVSPTSLRIELSGKDFSIDHPGQPDTMLVPRYLARVGGRLLDAYDAYRSARVRTHRWCRVLE